MPFQKGHKVNLGRKLIDEIKAKQSASLKGRNLEGRNGLWKGEGVSYKGLHIWLNSRLGKATRCENGHLSKRYVWANIPGEYRRSLDDYRQLCQGCNLKDGIKKHERFDK